MSEPVNKFLLEVEEIYCTSCVHVTGHVLTGKYWTCCNCGNQQGKKKGFFRDFMDDINLAIFKRKTK
jgi:hypothetical protein